ncbi:MAG: AAA family ATPase [Prevotellaceae bacterium]|jgi:predicted ATP-binding protein involved in virulence|nr:AAA family ATPase [Prevotellaceae bacterium]
MELKSIKIQKLFGLFDYNIELNNAENLTILTGPNGYGKTTILNIIYNLFNQRFFYFQKLSFDSISFHFSENRRIDISKKDGKPKTEQRVQIINNTQQIVVYQIPAIDIQIDLFVENNRVETFVYNAEAENQLVLELGKYIPVQKISQNTILDNRTGNQLSVREFLIENSAMLPAKVIDLVNEQGNQLLQSLNSTNVYLIREQRLLTQPLLNNKVSFANTIDQYAKELKELIANKQFDAYQVTQKLDSSFPKRLIECKKDLQKDEFDDRFAKLIEKQKQLQQFGISTSEQGVTEYNKDTAKVLSVYLDDSEKKIGVYDDLLSKIELFVNILNEKRFAFKSIVINSSQGFYFQTSNGQKLNLTDLSSGEQQEVVLLYELLFKTNPNTLILIDEPEISLHVIWQKSFIRDLQKIAKMKQISFFVSTHAPQIINDRWDLTRDLFDLANIK